MIGIEFIKCSCCEEDFKKGTGHLCLCPNCDTKHPFCDDCYQSLLKDGTIKKVDYKEKDMSEQLVRKWK